jgi:hypothetical protein
MIVGLILAAGAMPLVQPVSRSGRGWINGDVCTD